MLNACKRMSAYKILWDKSKSHIGELPYCNRKCGKIRRLIRLLYYLSMERMIESRDIKHMACVERIKQLEQENKKLKENYAKLDKVARENVRTLDELEAKRIELEEENKKLKEENEKLREELSAYDREYFDEDKKAKNIYKSQKENILM